MLGEDHWIDQNNRQAIKSASVFFENRLTYKSAHKNCTLVVLKNHHL
jgi:hypothetical protein